MAVAYVVLGVMLFIVLLWLFLVYPARASVAQRAVFARRNYAHRGLHDNAAGCPENSLAAFEAAMRAGYGCELDVQFTKDKQLIVFHDDDFLRVCGEAHKVWELTWAEIQGFRLLGTQEKIPLFSEVLALCAGRAPLIVEIKSEGPGMAWNNEVCAETMRQLRGYSGDYCVESFHPLVVRWFYKNAPDVLRGLLVSSRDDYGSQPKALGFALNLLLVDCLCRPQFIAFAWEARNAALRAVKRLGALSVMWTVKDAQTGERMEQQEDAVIFEGYLPKTGY